MSIPDGLLTNLEIICQGKSGPPSAAADSPSVKLHQQRSYPDCTEDPMRNVNCRFKVLFLLGVMLLNTLMPTYARGERPASDLATWEVRVR